MSILRYKVLLDQTAAGNGEWIDLDVRYSNGETRAIMCELTSSDTVIIQAIVKDVRGIDKSFLDTLDTDDIVVLKTFSADGEYVFDAPYTYIRAVKTGTTGNAKVSGFI
jgi:hypothetical protein